MSDIRPTIALIFLAAILAIMFIGATAVVANQHTAICLDHPTYRKCAEWDH